ncbi:MAG TPA: hypothetical protein VMT53_22665 [Terriglobales bacterium]|nr:hypothetical protein [Terriglobales bacterium]
MDAKLAVRGHVGVWALGDCAAVVDAKSGTPCPPTAQFALHEAKALAKNIRASIQGCATHGSHFDSRGVGYATLWWFLGPPTIFRFSRIQH